MAFLAFKILHRKIEGNFQKRLAELGKVSFETAIELSKGVVIFAPRFY